MAQKYSRIIAILLLAVLDGHFSNCRTCSIGNTMPTGTSAGNSIPNGNDVGNGLSSGNGISNSKHGQFLDLRNPASCDGTFTNLSLCFPIISLSQEPQEIILRLWRRQQNDQMLEMAGEITLEIEPLNQATGTSLEDCATRMLNPADQVEVRKGDVLGVAILLSQDSDIVDPFAVISDNENATGLFQDTRPSSEFDRPLTDSDLTLRSSLELNIYAEYASSTPLVNPSPSILPAISIPNMAAAFTPIGQPLQSPQASLQDQINTVQHLLTPSHTSTRVSLYLPTTLVTSLSTPQGPSTSSLDPQDVSVVTAQPLEQSVVHTGVPLEPVFTPLPKNTGISDIQEMDVTSIDALATPINVVSTKLGSLSESDAARITATSATGEITLSIGPLPTPSITGPEMPPGSALVAEVMASSLGSGSTSTYSGLPSRSSLFGLDSTPVQVSPTGLSTHPDTSLDGLPSAAVQPSIALESSLFQQLLVSSIEPTITTQLSPTNELPSFSEPQPSAIPSQQALDSRFPLTTEGLASPTTLTNPNMIFTMIAVDESIPSTIAQPSLSTILREPSSLQANILSTPTSLPSTLPSEVRSTSLPQPVPPSTQDTPTLRTRELTASLIAVTVAVIFLFVTLSGCVMIMILYVVYCRAKMDQVSSKGKGMDNPSYFTKQRDDSVTTVIVPISEEAPSQRPNQLNISLESTSGSNDNVVWNLPFIERNSSERSTGKPASAVTRNLSSTIESEVEVIEMGDCDPERSGIPRRNNAQSEPVAESCAIDMPQDIFPPNSRTMTMTSKHDYEEVEMNNITSESRVPAPVSDHVYDEPDETDPGINLKEARGYEEPVKRSWKRLSLPSLENHLHLEISQKMRRNSSASELHSSGSYNPQPKSTRRILHYAEFSLYPEIQTESTQKANESKSGASSVHKPLSCLPSKEPHQYDEPSFLPQIRHMPCPIPAPTRVLQKRRIHSEYESPPVMTTPPLLRSKSSHSVMRRVRLKIHHLSANMTGVNLNDEMVRLIQSESEGRGESSELPKSPESEAFSSQDTNSSNNDFINNSLTMDGAYFFPSSDEEELQCLLRKLSIEVIPRNSIESKTNDQVQRGVWRKDSDTELDVTLKSVDFSESETDAEANRVKLLQEAAIMRQFRHPNIVRLYGIVDEDRHAVLVSEHFPRGDLRKILVQMGRSVIPTDTPKLLLTYSQQIALGMQYLASKGFVHRDLCARNVFVTDDDVCKVGGFGKSRDLTDVNDYIMKGGRVQVRWTAPEAMYYRQYSTASDVWSYGCLLYEIWSLGRMPFRDISNAEVIEKVDSGYRLPPPPGCPLVLYNLMIQCWHSNPFSRPCFKDIINTLLRDEERVLQIPIRDASTHESAIILGANLKAGSYMYSDLQQKYTRQLSRVESGTSKNGHDYDHIQEDQFMFTFPTSSADLATKNKMAAKKEDVGEKVVDSVSSVPQPSIYSTPVECDKNPPFTSPRGVSRKDSNFYRIHPSDYEDI